MVFTLVAARQRLHSITTLPPLLLVQEQRMVFMRHSREE